MKSGRTISIKKEKINYAKDTSGGMSYTKDLIQSYLQLTYLDLQYDGATNCGNNKTMDTHGKNKTNSSLLVQTKCLYGVIYEDSKVTDLLELKRELHLCYKSKIKGLKLDLKIA